MMPPQPGRQGALCVVVLSSVAEAVLHGAQLYGGTQLICRHTTGPQQAIWSLHWPYRNTLQQTRRLSQVLALLLHSHGQVQQDGSQNGSQPDEQCVHSALQSM